MLKYQKCKTSLSVLRAWLHSAIPNRNTLRWVQQILLRGIADRVIWTKQSQWPSLSATQNQQFWKSVAYRVDLGTLTL